jgi:hypothetical protein
MGTRYYEFSCRRVRESWVFRMRGCQPGAEWRVMPLETRRTQVKTDEGASVAFRDSDSPMSRGDSLAQLTSIRTHTRSMTIEGL